MSVNSIGDRQIKAARALLDWSQEDLAQASRLSVATIRKLEIGHISPRCSTTSVIRETFEKAGIEFLNSEGVRRRQEGIIIFQGNDATEAFLEDMVHTARKNGGEILIVASSLFGLSFAFGGEEHQVLEDVVAHNGEVSIKIILTNTLNLPNSLPRLECRSLSTNYVDPMPFCVYGDKYALFASNEHEEAKIIVVQSTVTALSSRRQFVSMWEKAMPFEAYMQRPKKLSVVRA